MVRYRLTLINRELPADFNARVLELAAKRPCRSSNESFCLFWQSRRVLFRPESRAAAAAAADLVVTGRAHPGQQLIEISIASKTRALPDDLLHP
jgi:hypothetical protein